MPTWEEVRAHLKSVFQIAQEAPTVVRLMWKVPVAGQEMTQVVHLGPVEVDKRAWLTMLGDLFPEQALPARSALLYQDRIPFGAVVVRNGAYFLRHGLLLDQLAWPDLERAVKMVAHESLRMRANLGSKPGDPAVFGGYED